MTASKALCSPDVVTVLMAQNDAGEAFELQPHPIETSLELTARKPGIHKQPLAFAVEDDCVTGATGAEDAKTKLCGGAEAECQLQKSACP